MEEPRHKIRALHTTSTITVYQAYAAHIGLPAVRQGGFPAAWKRDRMTWIKPGGVRSNAHRSASSGTPSAFAPKTPAVPLPATRALRGGHTFPDALRWLDAPSGESVATLDAYITGCISVYLEVGALDDARRSALGGWLDDLRGVMSHLHGEDAGYVTLLLRMAELIVGTTR
ncbi:DUF4291 family protein [Spirillospora sp. NPDC048819]|uniref:DUF4291 family protein n=1 Tax=Spirillospora sp. NPDC048819 TaxID=3155268 RepID=UPI0033DE6607